MRVTFILPAINLGGGTRVIGTYAKKLVGLGHEVCVLVPGPRVPGVWARIKAACLGRQLRDERLQYKAGLEAYFADIRATVRVLDENRAIEDRDVPDSDVVVATFWATVNLVLSLSPTKGARAFFLQGYEVVPGQTVDGMEEAWSAPLHKLVISKWLMEIAANRFGDRDVTYVPNSVDAELFNAPERSKQIVPTIGVLYSPHPIKGLDIAVRAIEAIRKVVPDLRVVAFGSEMPTRELPLPAGSEFSYRPAQQEIREIYAKCDLWLCGSRSDGFYLPMLEAMACRCPVVATSVGGPVDVIQDGVNGYVVPIEDSAALAERSLRVLRLDARSWRAMSDAALQSAVRYSWDDAARIFEAGLIRACEKVRNQDAGS